VFPVRLKLNSKLHCDLSHSKSKHGVIVQTEERIASQLHYQYLNTKLLSMVNILKDIGYTANHEQASFGNNV
jgi:hypothetical protein